MTLQYTRTSFVECPVCRAKPGSPPLCAECLERRELHWLRGRIEQIASEMIDRELCGLVTICQTCNGTPDPKCKEHGR